MSVGIEWSYDTIQGFKDVFFDWGFMNPSELQIGGYNWNMSQGPNGTVVFKITNNASLKSFAGESFLRRKYVQGKQAVENKVNPLIDRANKYSPWDAPNLSIPVWDSWPIHERPDVPLSGNIRQDFIFTMPSPCCPK